MARIIFEINYDVNPDRRDEYLQTIRELRDHLTNGSIKNYLVFENKQKPNNFTEMYICENEAEFDALDDESNEVTNELTSRIISEYAVDSKTRYSTHYEID